MRITTTLLLLLAVSGFTRAGTSNSLMDLTPDGSKLLVANTDTGTVSIVDVKTRHTLAEIPVGDHPEGTAWVGNGPLGLVTVYGDDKVLIVNADSKKIVKAIPVSDEPYGIVTTPDGKFAYVSHDYPGTISEIDIAAQKVTRTFPAGSGIRGIALSNDGRTLYVTEFFTANLIALDRQTGQIVDRWNGYSTDNLARHVVLHPKRGKAYLSHIRSRITAFDARGSIFPQLSFCDLDKKPEGEKRRRSLAMDTFNNVYVVTNPWEAALSPDGKKIYTLYAGTNDMNISAVLDDDYVEIERIGNAVTVGKHPRAIRVSPDGKEVYIYNTLDYAVAVFTGDMRRKLATIPVATPAHTPEWRRGKELFQSALQPMGSARWIACSSCHPDGLTDGRVWENPEGNRRTPSLFGLAHTHPIHWSADRDEVQDFEYTIRGKLMKGRGLVNGPLEPRKGFAPGAELNEKLAGRSADLDALALYTNAFPMRLSPHILAPGKLSPEAERGKKLFFSTATQCATCHSGPYYTDGKKDPPFNLHDVGTGVHKREKMGPKFDTPTLLGVYRVAPYLHDGRAPTLRDVLTTANPKDQHGKTSHLKPGEIDDLVAFLKSLPYELPPEQTPNTVRHFLRLKPITTPPAGGAGN
ncbi:MAG: beta-propeller fold lactonase family protein [Bacteroidales bacterium]|nr:beta-propeller fold lactonase family protein [Bacteroidales bacterium]